MKPKVKCPTCDKRIAWDPESRWRPFCSERCKMLDLGDWFNESNTIAGQGLHDPSDGLPWMNDGTRPHNDDDF